MKRTIFPITCLALSSLAAHAPTPIRVALFDIAGLRAGILTAMKTGTSGIIRTAGMELVWVECAIAGKPAKNPECAVPLGTEPVHAAVGAGLKNDDAGGCGLGFREGQGGVLACVYPDWVNELAREASWDFGDLLGHSAAHELGHLILRSDGHTEGG